ncbi:DUF4179 domain-containing protein [Desulfosporosinus sp. PR]|uniref:DUF4179 domain-containing protein n=1 Tax=Candidatus Desulfosporosinus nitrosoreducens TaxID=3401928 RepID=UPI0027EAAAE6|nr:DUF4179 domain-containing protein [Desulfosporosinus sp. PR]MDQ7096657.1 DUF4179 domain-containing protein [Desulfosporosinus sp. PR]
MNYKDFNLEEKDIFKLFNQVSFEENESELNDLDCDEISQFQKEKIKKHLNKRIKGNFSLRLFKYCSTAVAVGLVCLIGIGTAYPAFAENVPILNSISQALNSQFGYQGNYAEYSQMINKSVTDNGITVTINEALADNSKLIIGYTIKSAKKINDLEVLGISRFLKINGKVVSGEGSGMGNYQDDNTYVGSEEFHTNLPQNSDRFNVDFDINDIKGIKGKWDFAFSVSKDELTKHSTVFNPEKVVDFPDSKVTIDKVVFSPIDTAILLSGNYTDKNRQLKDSIFDYNYWLAFDDEGVELIPKGIGGGSSNLTTQTFHSEMDYETMKNIPKYLTIVPCKIIPSAGGGVKMDADGKEAKQNVETEKPVEINKVIDGVYPIELPQGGFGKLIINEINTENDTTTINFTAEGKAPYFQATEFFLKDNTGEILIPKTYVKRKDKQNPNEFTIAFTALDPNKKYTVSTTALNNVELREDLKFKIELNN